MSICHIYKFLADDDDTAATMRVKDPKNNILQLRTTAVLIGSIITGFRQEGVDVSNTQEIVLTEQQYIELCKRVEIFGKYEKLMVHQTIRINNEETTTDLEVGGRGGRMSFPGLIETPSPIIAGNYAITLEPDGFIKVVSCPPQLQRDRQNEISSNTQVGETTLAGVPIRQIYTVPPEAVVVIGERQVAPPRSDAEIIANVNRRRELLESCSALLGGPPTSNQGLPFSESGFKEPVANTEYCDVESMSVHLKKPSDLSSGSIPSVVGEQGSQSESDEGKFATGYVRMASSLVDEYRELGYGGSSALDRLSDMLLCGSKSSGNSAGQLLTQGFWTYEKKKTISDEKDPKEVIKRLLQEKIGITICEVTYQEGIYMKFKFSDQTSDQELENDAKKLQQYGIESRVQSTRIDGGIISTSPYLVIVNGYRMSLEDLIKKLNEASLVDQHRCS